MKTPNWPIAAGALALAVVAAPSARAQDDVSTKTTEQGPAIAAEKAFQPPPVTSDNEVWYRAQPLSHDPFVLDPKGKAKNVVKNMFHFEHTDTGGLVWNSLTVTALFADAAEPAGGQNAGSLELYMTYRGDISATGFGRPPITLPGVADVQFEFGGDLNFKDDAYQARRKFLLVGPNFVLDLPGSVTFAVHLAQEFNHDAITGHDPVYHPTWNTELSWTEYFDTARMFRWEGVFNMTGAKGTDTGLSKTVTEFYTYHTLVLDLGQVLHMAPHKLDLFTGLQYWVHKFGYPSRGDPGAIEFTPYLGVGVHF